MEVYINKKLNIKIRYTSNWEIREETYEIQLKEKGVTRVRLHANSIVDAYSNSKVDAYANSKVDAYANSKVYAYDNSIVNAYANSIVDAYANSIVNAYNNSKVDSYDFSCIYQKSIKTKIKLFNHYGKIVKQKFEVKKKMIVYKKLEKNLICELELTKGQVFQSENHSKCRTNTAKVIKIENIDGTKCYPRGYSQYNKDFIYELGKIVNTEYDENIKECSTGIHFYLSRHSAEKH